MAEVREGEGTGQGRERTSTDMQTQSKRLEGVWRATWTLRLDFFGRLHLICCAELVRL